MTDNILLVGVWICMAFIALSTVILMLALKSSDRDGTYDVGDVTLECEPPPRPVRILRRESCQRGPPPARCGPLETTRANGYVVGPGVCGRGREGAHR